MKRKETRKRGKNKGIMIKEKIKKNEKRNYGKKPKNGNYL